jgi:integrase
MAKPRKNEIVRCTYFIWKLSKRGKMWYADGRSNPLDAGRHSLGTTEKDEALKRLPELDRVRAEDLGLITRSPRNDEVGKPLPLEEGRKSYEKHIARSRVTGGVRKSTQKRYRTVFDKFIPFAKSLGIHNWNSVAADVLNSYANHLEKKDYKHKTLVNELTTLKQAVKALIELGHLPGMTPIDLKIRKAESEPAYCYRGAETAAMIQLCCSEPSLRWLADVIIALACTGLRIAELASLRWSDLDLENRRLNLTDETGRQTNSNRNRRELKSGRSRSFPIHHDLFATFDRLPKTDAYVFHGPRGGRLKPDTVRRILIRDVIAPLSEKFPTPDGERGFIHGRLHSFRHYFCSTCANSNVPERIVMEWLGHADSEMVRRYYHLHDDESRRRMNQLDFLGGAGRWSVGDNEEKLNEESVEPNSSEKNDASDAAE